VSRPRIEESYDLSPLASTRCYLAWLAVELPVGGLPDLAHAPSPRKADGIFCLPWTMRDPLLDPLRTTAEFQTLVAQVEARHRDALAAFTQSGRV